MFKELLERAGLTKAELGRRLGLNPRTVSGWGDSPPEYAVAYLKLLIDYNRVRP
jgi:DNA-binding XRE family transcriptional regulator